MKNLLPIVLVLAAFSVAITAQAGPDPKGPKALPERIADLETRVERLEKMLRTVALPPIDPRWVDDLKPPPFVAGKSDPAMVVLAKWVEAYAAADRVRFDLDVLRSSSLSQKGTVAPRDVEIEAAAMEIRLSNAIAEVREWKRKYEEATKK